MDGLRREAIAKNNLSTTVHGGLDHSKSTNVTLKPPLIFKGVPSDCRRSSADIFIVHTLLLLYECASVFIIASCLLSI